MKRILVVAIAAACSSQEPAANRLSDPPAAVPPPIKQRPRHEVMADKVIAAIASGDYEQVNAMLSPTARTELDEMNRESFRKLLANLEVKRIDIKQAKIVKVEHFGDKIDSVEIQLVHGTQKFRIGFAVMALHGYDLMSVGDRIE